MSDAVLSRRGLLIMGVAARLNASDSDFWNKKPPANWTPEEISRLLAESPWAKEIKPTYTSLPPPADNRPWNENPPVGRGPIPSNRPPKISVKAPYQVTICWESADPIREARKIALPEVFGEYYVLGVLFPYAAHRDLGSKLIENLKESAVLLGARTVDAAIVQVYPEVTNGFLVGFPKTSTRGVRQFEFSARVGLLALKAKFDSREMLYHGQLAL